MRQIPIDYKADFCVQWYSKKMKTTGIRKKALNRIDSLIHLFSNHTQVEFCKKNKFEQCSVICDYLERLKDRYDALKTMHPTKFSLEIKEFERIIDRKYINCKIKIDGAKESASLASRIVSAMHYNDMRQDVYPPIARSLGIKACVYCNANYVISDAKGIGYYDLDHWKPKSLYPYLCTSFFNLQPTCSSCNRHKLDDDKPYFRLWGRRGNKAYDVLGINLTRKSIVHYMMSHDVEKLQPHFFAYRKSATMIKDNTEKRLHIERIYEEHKDVAEEIIWKYMAYNKSYLIGLKRAIKDAVPNISDTKRFIIGNYADPDEIHKRPLANFVQNIAKQLKLE